MSQEAQPTPEPTPPPITGNVNAIPNNVANEAPVASVPKEAVSKKEDEAEKKEALTNGQNGDSPRRTPSKLPPGPRRSDSSHSQPKSPSKPSPKTPDTPSTADKKKVPMNKIQVGAAPSPNLKSIKSKIGSLGNTSHRPGGGQVKIETKKLDFSKTTSKITAKNDTYTPGGGDKKITQVKLQWNAKPKVGSLENATHKPGGGEKKIESVKLDFKDKAKSKVGSKDNIKHVAGGGNIKIEDQKLDIKAQSKVGSMDNVKHKPGGGDKKIFDDKEYIRQMAELQQESLSASQGSLTRNSSTASRSKSLERCRLEGAGEPSERANSVDRKPSQSEDKLNPVARPEPQPTDQNSNQLTGRLEIRPGGTRVVVRPQGPPSPTPLPTSPNKSPALNTTIYSDPITST